MNIPLSRLIPHPHAPTKPTETVKRKLLAHIQTTGLYPPIIVRSLKNSKRWPNRNGKLQIIDGHLRCDILRTLNAKSANVVNFGPLTDDQTHVLLLTLNRLRCPDDPQRRAHLIHTYAKANHLALADLEKHLPETKRTLERLMDLTRTSPKIHAPKNPKNLPKPFAVYLTPAQHQHLTNALKRIRTHHQTKTTADALALLAKNTLNRARQ